MTDRLPLNLEQQADFMRYLLDRMKMRDGRTAGQALMFLTSDEAKDLEHIEARLRRMAPHEQAIKRAVMGK